MSEDHKDADVVVTSSSTLSLVNDKNGHCSAECSESMEDIEPTSPSTSPASKRLRVEDECEKPEDPVNDMQKSRRQRKREEKRAMYAAYRVEKRRKEKERRKERRKILLEKGLSTPSSASILRQTLKIREAIVNSGQLKHIRIALDLDFDNMMNENDLSKCVKQCMFIYASSRRTLYPIDLHFTGLKANGEIHSRLLKNSGYRNWKITEHLNERHTSVFPKEELIYLSSDSETVLDKLTPENVYVIGGLVDHNHYKSFCWDRAQEDGIRTARLPLLEYIDLKTRTVLTSVHVFQILARVLEGKPWLDAIMQSIPTRKGATAKHLNNTVDSNPTSQKDPCSLKKNNEQGKEEGGNS